MQTIELRLPLPRGVRDDLEAACEWQAEIFHQLGLMDWTVRPSWILALGRHGELRFTAEREDMATTSEVAALKSAFAEGQKPYVVLPTFSPLSERAKKLGLLYEALSESERTQLCKGHLAIHWSDRVSAWIPDFMGGYFSGNESQIKAQQR